MEGPSETAKRKLKSIFVAELNLSNQKTKYQTPRNTLEAKKLVLFSHKERDEPTRTQRDFQA